MPNTQAPSSLDLDTLMHMGVPMSAGLVRAVAPEQVAEAKPSAESNGAKALS
jgi:hypothetical protein